MEAEPSAFLLNDLDQIADHDKTDSAHKNQNRQQDEREWSCLPLKQTVSLQGKSRVAESRNGVKKSIKKVPLDPAPTQSELDQEGPGQFDDDREKDNVEDNPFGIRFDSRDKEFPDQAGRSQGNPHMREKEVQGIKCDDTEPAELDAQ